MFKKTILIILLFCCTALLAMAAESEFFVRSVPISRVYLYKEGYRVLYLKNDMSFEDMYLPIDWFTTAGGKGELVLGDDASYPYFSIFWKNGEFAHIRLYLRKDMRDPSWGKAMGGDTIADRFKDEPPVLEF